MKSKFVKIVLGLSFMAPLSVYAQDNKEMPEQLYVANQTNKEDKVHIDFFGSVLNSIRYVSIGNGNLSSLGLKYSESFNKMAPSVNLSFCAGLSRNNLYGITYSYTYAHNNIADAQMNSNLSMYSIGFVSRGDWRKNNLFYSSDCNLSYIHYRNRYIPWDAKIERGTVTAHGVELDLSFSAGYLFDKGWGLGLQCGIKGQQLYKWLGDERFIDPNAYNGGLFTSKCNTIISPYIGLAVYFRYSNKDGSKK